MASAISEVTGRPVEFRELDPATAKAEILEDGALEWLADTLVGLQVAFGKGTADLNNDHVFRVTGNHPRSFATFASDHAETHRQAVSSTPPGIVYPAWDISQSQSN